MSKVYFTLWVSIILYIIRKGPVDAFMLAWVIDYLVQTISGYQPDKCYIILVTRSIQALLEMYALSPWAYMIHFRQSPHARVTTIT